MKARMHTLIILFIIVLLWLATALPVAAGVAWAG
jgi:hypothetical protein